LPKAAYGKPPDYFPQYCSNFDGEYRSGNQLRGWCPPFSIILYWSLIIYHDHAGEQYRTILFARETGGLVWDLKSDPLSNWQKTREI